MILVASTYQEFLTFTASSSKKQVKEIKESREKSEHLYTSYTYHYIRSNEKPEKVKTSCALVSFEINIIISLGGGLDLLPHASRKQNPFLFILRRIESIPSEAILKIYS